jgi:hypothetical protein
MLCIRGWGEVEGFPQGLKPSVILWSFGTTEVVPRREDSVQLKVGPSRSRRFCVARGRAGQIDEKLCRSR